MLVTMPQRRESPTGRDLQNDSSAVPENEGRPCFPLLGVSCLVGGRGGNGMGDKE